MKVIALAAIALFVAAPVSRAQTDDLWYMSHVGALECVPLHDLDMTDPEHPVAFGQYARTPAAFVKELTDLGYTGVKLDSNDGNIAGVSMGASKMRIFIIRGLAGCKGAVNAIRGEK
jgi:hypothetical protein